MNSDTTTPSNLILHHGSSESDGSTPLEFGQEVLFRHPGYLSENFDNVILKLPAFDLSGTGVRGIHYGTARLACAIIAGNAWDGYLTTSRKEQKLSLSNDELLVEDEYWFHIPPKVGAYQKRMGYQAQRYLYPIYPNFHHWCFPHGHLPPSWNGSAPNPRNESNVSNEDMFCQAKHQDDYTEKVYLCPTSEQEWFERQSMTYYGRDTTSLANIVILSGTLSRMLNKNSFVFALKQNQWTVQYIGANPRGSTYHNCIANPNVNISSELLLVRFAYTIFQRRELAYFLDRSPEVHVRLQVGIESSPEPNASIKWSQNPKLHHAAVHDCNLVAARKRQLRIRLQRNKSQKVVIDLVH